MSDPTLWATTEDADVAAPARTFIRWLLTVGAAILYAVLVSKVCADVWNGSATVDSVYAGVMNSLGLTFGSAFVGWFGVTTTQANVTVAVPADGGQGGRLGRLRDGAQEAGACP